MFQRPSLGETLLFCETLDKRSIDLDYVNIDTYLKKRRIGAENQEVTGSVNSALNRR